MATTPGSSHTTQTLRNVIVGVTTTVLASTIVYFLGFHKPGGSSSTEAMFITEKATIKAWNDYVATENSFTEGWKILENNYSKSRFKDYKERTLEELDKFFEDIKTLISTKDIDRGFISLLKRRLAAKEQWKNKYKIHLDNYEDILNNTPQAEQYEKLNEELRRFQVDVKDIDERFTSEIKNFTRSLSDKYDRNFSTTSLLFLQKVSKDSTQNYNNNKGTGHAFIDRQSLVGTWLIDQNWYIYHYDDGRLYMYFTRADGAKDSSFGTWQITNNQLYQYATYYFNAGNKWVYDVSDVSTDAFSMQMTVSPFTRYTAKRVR